eukprot:GFUD01032727.1.p1 GENE.GFUD01032727.1~~GFUD01032727.1.p1  ORF type:complete len:831 (+),score=176.79 GFUD01032727.1:54-2546(+)
MAEEGSQYKMFEESSGPSPENSLDPPAQPMATYSPTIPTPSPGIAPMEDYIAQYEEKYEDYGQHEKQSYPGGLDSSMTGADGNKGSESYDFNSPEELDMFVSREGPVCVCTVCGVFRNKSITNVRCHIESKHFPGRFTYTCQICGKQCKSKTAFRDHSQSCKRTLASAGMPEETSIVKKKPKPKVTESSGDLSSASFPCDQCDDTFSSSKDWMAHIRESENHEAVCKACDTSFGNFDNLRHHKRKYHFEKAKNPDFVCDSCGKSCKTRDLLKDHWNFVHKVETGLNCNLCGKSCQNMLKLKRHTMKCLSRDPEIVAQEMLQFQLSSQTKYQPFVNKNSGESSMSGPGTEPPNLKDGMSRSASCKERKENIPSLSDENKSENNFDIKEEGKVLEFDVSHLVEPKLGSDRKSEEEQVVDKFDELEGLVKIETEPDIDVIEVMAKGIETGTGIEGFVGPPVKKHRKLNSSKIAEGAKVCPICSKEVKYLNTHIKEVHTETPDGNHICNDCGKAFSTKKKMRNHIYNHHKMQPTMCPICAKEVKYLNGHMKEVHTETHENHGCNDCEKVFTTKKKLRGHIDTIHKMQSTIDSIPTVAKVCPICAKEVKYLKGHIKEVHTETPHQNHICNDCGKAYSTKKKLRGHIDTIHKLQPTMCPICAKEVKYLNAHIKIVHTDTPAKNLICDDCGKVFSTSKKLRGHVNATHKMLPSMCEICCQVLKNPHSLRGHKRKVHEEINEVTCPSCFKVFDTQQKLYYHERAVHTLEDSRCEACGRTYKNKNLLQKHQKVYHKELYEAQTKYFENTNAANSINGTLGMSSTPVNAHPMKQRVIWYK